MLRRIYESRSIISTIIISLSILHINIFLGLLLTIFLLKLIFVTTFTASIIFLENLNRTNLTHYLSFSLRSMKLLGPSVSIVLISATLIICSVFIYYQYLTFFYLYTKDRCHFFFKLLKIFMFFDVTGCFNCTFYARSPFFLDIFTYIRLIRTVIGWNTDGIR